MALFTARARPRAARLSTPAMSCLKSKDRQMYLYLYILGVALLLVISVSLLQLGLTGTPPDPAHDPRHMRKGASEDLRVHHRHKGESIRHENYKDGESPSRRRRPPVMNSGSRSKDWKVEKKKGAEEVHGFSDSEGRDINDAEEQGENSRIYQGQQLDDMDKFDREETKEDNVLKHQGQVLDDMDKFDNANRRIFGDDSVPKFVEDLGRSRKLQPSRPESSDGESRKLGRNGRNGVESKEIGHPLVSEDKIPIRQAPVAKKGSVRAAIEQEMEKRNGRDSLRRSLGETNVNPTSLHVKEDSQESSGMAPLRGFKEFLDDGKSSLLDTDDKPVDTNVKGEHPGDARMQVKLPLWDDVQTTVEDVVVHSLHVEENNKADGEQSSGLVQERAEINNLDTMNALTTSTNATAYVEASKAQEHLESADMDVVRTDTQVTKEKPLEYDEDVRNEGEEKLDAEKNLEGGKNLQGEKSLKKLDGEKNPEVEKNLEGEKNLQSEENWGAEEDDSEIEVEEQVELRTTSRNGSAVKVKEVRGGKVARKKDEEEDEDHDNLIQWGFYPTLGSTLKFSKFLSSFFKQENCSLRIFMAWTTAPWAYTPRHQRAIESILHFHPQACIVVFTETIDFQFFDSWVKEGYKIAVARPNLEELLGKTPAIDFAYVWYEWRNMNLFYIHYTELLRIAALHKYGGVWLDMDMILARPLPKLHNVLGSTVSEDGEWVLNGAFMSFDKSSSFLKACIEEFVATYDETSLGWNGADLLNRVASNATRKGGKVWLEHSEHLQVLEPIAFFPLSRHSIIKYFSAPKSTHERVKQEEMLSAILNESHGTHLWNSVTGRHVPEVGSLVEKLLNRFCMRCTDIL